MLTSFPAIEQSGNLVVQRYEQEEVQRFDDDVELAPNTKLNAQLIHGTNSRALDSMFQSLHESRRESPLKLLPAGHMAAELGKEITKLDS